MSLRTSSRWPGIIEPIIGGYRALIKAHEVADAWFKSQIEQPFSHVWIEQAERA
jgi:hypothetical protein